MVGSLIGDLAAITETRLEIILTQNIPEVRNYFSGAIPFNTVRIKNAKPKGFGANHNAAFGHAKGDFFCVLNPDIRIPRNPFPALLAELSRPKIGVAAPRILGPTGGIEDSARRFPTAAFLLRKALEDAPIIDYPTVDKPISPDWVAGMFMLFRREIFAEVGGFDESYFLYYEDVDLCRRLRRRGLDVRMVPSVDVIHDARRASRRSLRYLRWHIESMLRYFLQPVK
jgi:GT2 family glycosyltransferase